MSNLLQQFAAARRASTPLIALRTPDPAATIQSIAQAENKNAPVLPLLQWDAVRGLTSLNKDGEKALAAATSDPDEGADAVGALIVAQKFPAETILFMHNAHRLLESLAVVQALWNLRDAFKSNVRSVVLLCPDVQLPPELSSDVLTLDEALPEADELAIIARDCYEAGGLDVPDETTASQAVDATAGLAAFPAEQVMAMSLTPNGLDMAALWERKRQVIEQTPGLAVWRGGETFQDIGGVENIKNFLGRMIHGRQTPRAIVFLDEIEKAIGGGSGQFGGDTSGVSQDQLGTLLSWMQDNAATGIICIGPPGCSKSMIAKATGNEAGVPTIQLDLGAMKGSLVGQSEQQIRSALKVVKAMAQDRVFFIATCNSIAVLPPELRRRFTFGTFFFDLPDAEERALIWTLYVAKYNIENSQVSFSDKGWTGAEIKQACEIAWRLDCSLDEAAEYIVPVSRSAADQIEQLRNQASGRFTSASYSGVYEKSKIGAQDSGVSEKPRRALKLTG